MMRDEDKSAIVFQKLIRGKIIRDKYIIQELTSDKATSYITNVVGNDPIMSELKSHEPEDKISFISTSGMRPISLACKVGNPKKIPKLFLIDNSNTVCEFWGAMKKFADDDTLAGTRELFEKNLPQFLLDNKNLYASDQLPFVARPGIKRLNPNIRNYFKLLFDKYGYEYVRAVIRHTTVIKQSWADPLLFVKLKNIHQYLGINKIYIYASNIVGYTAFNDTKKVADQILQNIESIQPTLSIHSNLEQTIKVELFFGSMMSCFSGYAGKVYFFENQSSKLVKNSLFSKLSPDNGLEKVLRKYIDQDSNESFKTFLDNNKSLIAGLGRV